MTKNHVIYTDFPAKDQLSMKADNVREWQADKKQTLKIKRTKKKSIGEKYAMINSKYTNHLWLEEEKKGERREGKSHRVYALISRQSITRASSV